MKIDKNILKAFAWVALVSIFAISILTISKSQNKDQMDQLRELKDIATQEQQRSELREQMANYKRDSAMAMMSKTQQEFTLLKSQYGTIIRNIAGLRIDFETQIKNLNNEKFDVPNATPNEQRDFLSKYRYSEY